jgi:hypothetical protein
MHKSRERSEQISRRVEPILDRMARANQKITYRMVAALVTETGEPLLDARALGWPLCLLAKRQFEQGITDTTCFVVLQDTWEVSSGWASCVIINGEEIGGGGFFHKDLKPGRARDLAHWARSPFYNSAGIPVSRLSDVK